MQNPASLRRWMVSGSEMARLIEEFQAAIEKLEKNRIIGIMNNHIARK